MTDFIVTKWATGVNDSKIEILIFSDKTNTTWLFTF